MKTSLSLLHAEPTNSDLAVFFCNCNWASTVGPVLMCHSSVLRRRFSCYLLMSPMCLWALWLGTWWWTSLIFPYYYLRPSESDGRASTVRDVPIVAIAQWVGSLSCLYTVSSVLYEYIRLINYSPGIESGNRYCKPIHLPVFPRTTVAYRQGAEWARRFFFFLIFLSTGIIVINVFFFFSFYYFK